MKMSSAPRSVVIISPEFPPFTNWGGVATFNEELSRLLAQLGFEVLVISQSIDWQFSVKEISPNVHHHLIGFKTKNKIFNVLYLKLIRKLLVLVMGKFPDLLFFLEWNFFSWNYFRTFAKNHKIVAIHAASYHSPAFLIKLLYPKIPLCIHIQGPQEYMQPFIAGGMDSVLKAKIESLFALKMSDVLVSCNEKLALELKKSLRKKIQSLYIPNFVTPQPLQFRGFNGPVTDNIIYWGRLEHRKGVGELLLAFAKFAQNHPSSHLWLIGSDDYTLKLKDTYLGLREFLYQGKFSEGVLNRIHHVPRIDDKDTLYRLVQKLQGIAIFPSLYEPFGFVYIEAMMLGLPTVGSTQGESVNIIRTQETGFLCRPTKNGILASLEEASALSRPKVSKIRRLARQEVEKKYSPAAVKKAYVDLYKILEGE